MRSSFCLSRLAAAAVLVVGAAGAQAANFSVASGNLTYHTDVVELAFRLDTASPLRVWTDSWQSGLNFDPVAAVWVSTGNDYRLVAQVDDDSTVGPGQGSFDAGLAFASLASGQYLVTLAASDNFARGTLLSAGFAFDGTPSIPIADWEQYSADPNTHDQKGSFWRVNLATVSAVPEPSSWLMMALGLALCGVAGSALSRRG